MANVSSKVIDEVMSRVASTRRISDHEARVYMTNLLERVFDYKRFVVKPRAEDDYVEVDGLGYQWRDGAWRVVSMSGLTSTIAFGTTTPSCSQCKQPLPCVGTKQVVDDPKAGPSLPDPEVTKGCRTCKIASHVHGVWYRCGKGVHLHVYPATRLLVYATESCPDYEQRPLPLS